MGKRKYVYAVYRHGSNAANQSMCPKMLVGTIEAINRKEACERMASRVTVYSNQWLSAIPFSRLGKKDQMIALEQDMYNDVESEFWDDVARDLSEN